MRADLSADELTLLARHDAITYALVSRLLGITKLEATDLVLDMTLDGLVYLAEAAVHDPTAKPGRRLVQAPIYRWVE